MSTLWKCPCCGLGNESTKSSCIACFANKDSKQESPSQSISECTTKQPVDHYSTPCIHINYLKKNITQFKIVNCAKCIAMKEDENLVFCLTCYQIYCARDSAMHHKENNHILCITLPTLKEYLKFTKDIILEMLTIYCYQCHSYLQEIDPYNIPKIKKIKSDTYQCLSISYEKEMCWDIDNDSNENDNNNDNTMILTQQQVQSNDTKPITISIRTQKGNIMQCEIKSDDTMKSIKSKIFEEHGILPQHQRLLYQGECLTDTDTPSMLGIGHTATLWLERWRFDQVECFNNDVDDNVFVSHMNMEEANALFVADKFDHRDNFGRVFPAKVANKLGSNVWVNYDGWPEKYNVWNDYKLQLWRFSKYESISRRPRHRLQDLKVGDYIDVNPMYSDCKGWKYAEITQIDQQSGQCQVVFGAGNGLNRNVYWVHLDNPEEVAPFTTKANGIIGQESQGINDIVDEKQNTDDKKEEYERKNNSNDDTENKEMIEEQRNDLFVCRECDRSFRLEIGLNSHVMAMHSNISDTEKSTKKKKRKKRKKKNKKNKKKKDGNKNKNNGSNNSQNQQRQKHLMDGKVAMTIDTEDSWECRTDESDQENIDVINDWKECPGTKGEIKKKILSESHWIGADNDIDEDSKVTVSYKIYYTDNGRECILAEKQKLDIIVDDDDRFTNAFHIALKSMKRREKAVFKILDNTLINVDDIYIDDDELKINKLNNNKRVSPNDKDTFYEIFIHDTVKEKEIGIVYTDNHCIQQGFKYKNDGNVLFQSGRYLGAIKKYQKALNWIDVQCKDDISLKKKKEELVISVNNNLSICNIKMKQWCDAIYFASKVLEQEPNNLKALIRRGQSRLENGSLELSKKDLETAQSLDKNNMYLLKLWEAWNIKYNKYVEKQDKINNLNDSNDYNDLNKLHLIQRDYNELLFKQQSNEMILEEMEGTQNELRSKLSEEHKRHCTEMEAMKNLNNKLRFDNIELNRAKKELSSKYESTLLKLYKLEKKYNEQQKRFGYKAWDNKDVTNWIINLDKTRYNKYYNILIQNIMNEGIDGRCLCDLDKNDLHRLGITQFKDKCDILKSIKYLIRNDNNTKKQDQGNKECVVCMDNPRCYSCIPCGHLCLCHICKDLIKKSCPVCQHKFTSFIKIYF